MAVDVKTAFALMTALRVVHQRGGACPALTGEGERGAAGEEVDTAAREYCALFGEYQLDARLADAVALGFLVGRPTVRRPALDIDFTTFLMDPDLVVRAAEGDAVLRLPWFDQQMFVGRQLPDVGEIPGKIRRTAVESYRAALAGDRNDYAFTSYGHPFSVEALPVRGENDQVAFVLAIASPGRTYGSASRAAERTAQCLDREADDARGRATQHRRAGRQAAALAEEKRAQSQWQAANTARAHAARLRSDPKHAAPPELTDRELDVLSLASHGLGYTGIAAELVVSSATVKTHLANIYAKLQVPDKAAAVALALRHGLID